MQFFDDEIYKMTFVGHKHIENYIIIEERLTEIISNIMRTKPYVEFYVGRNGELDILVALVIKRLKKEIEPEQCYLILTLPYFVADLESYQDYYDEVILPEEIQVVHPKRAITARNHWLVEKCDLLVTYVENDKNSGAGTMLKYAEKSKKCVVINLFT